MYCKNKICFVFCVLAKRRFDELVCPILDVQNFSAEFISIQQIQALAVIATYCPLVKNY